ncbi:MAG TPA: LLM class flavin-dependent oxidoreductase [Thermoleophilaceae bacterium]
MRLAVSVGISPRESLRDWAEFSAKLEQRGVDRLWLIDSQLAMKDVYAGLNAAAAATSRIELGPGVTNLLTRHPSVTAGAMAALAELSDGRALLGLGAGDSAVRGIGARPSRIAEVEQAVRFFRAVLAGEPAEWDGRELKLPHRPLRVPIHLAVSRPRMCRLAGALADGAIVMGAAEPELVAQQVGWIGEGAQEAGRDPGEVELAFVATTSPGDDRAALDDVRSWASAQARLLAEVEDLPPSLEAHRDELVHAKESYDFGEHLSTRAGHQASVSDELVRLLAVAGDADTCAKRLRGLLEAGVGEFIFPLMGGGRLERLKRLRDEVLPALAPL